MAPTQTATVARDPGGVNCTGVGIDRSGVHLDTSQEACQLTYPQLVEPNHNITLAGLPFRFREEFAEDGQELTIDVEGHNATVADRPSLRRFAVLSGTIWHPSAVGNDGQIDAEVAGILVAVGAPSTFDARAEDSSGNYRRMTLRVRRSAPPVEGRSALQARCDEALADQVATDESYRYCIDARSDTAAPVLVSRTVPEGTLDVPGVILPNRWIYVATIQRCGVVVGMTGTRGFSTGETDRQGFGNRLTADAPLSAGTCGPTSPTTVSVAPIGPRIPGDATITIKRGTENTSPTLTLDTQVPSAYVGAIRLGISGLFGGARQSDFAVETLPGSAQPEVVQRSGRAFDTEFVLGFSLFLPDLLHPNGGRIYGPRRNPFWYFIPSPYIGVSLVGFSATNTVTPPGSIYLGLEWELVRGVSIAPAVVFRNVHRLVDGVRVGQPWPSATGAPTLQRDQFDFGLGVVINISPSFFNIMRAPFSG